MASITPDNVVNLSSLPEQNPQRAARKWHKWSLQTSTERAHEQLMSIGAFGGFVIGADNARQVPQ
eukprot:6457498-Amphidinium_carterae.2